jgi:DNA-binding response OmpR family regulator
MTEPNLAARSRSSARRVLIVEKHAGLADMVADTLQRYGHTTCVIQDFAAVVSVAIEFRPDAAIVGIDSLRAKGYEIAQALRGNSDFVGCVVVAFTRDPSEQVAAAFH